jgi:hypothetical protein
MKVRRGLLGAVALLVGIAGLQGCRLIPNVAPQITGCTSIDPTGDQPSGALTPATATPDHRVNVGTNISTGPAAEGLTGVVWNSGSTIDPLGPVQPSIVRIDGSLGSVSPSQDAFNLQPLLDRVARIRAIGAEPLVLLSYMPTWLGQPRATAGQDPSRMGPYDLDLWQELVTKVVRGLATAPQPAYRFEVWNEPDIGIFWQDTTEQFLATALRTHQAVQTVEEETNLPLEVGGTASFYGGSALLPTYVEAVADAHLPLDFVTWHHYANFPYLGPDGPEGNLDPALYQALARRNPDATPLRVSAEIRSVRAEVDAALGDSGLRPALSIDEWNVSAGGYDLRHDTAEGAALDAGMLIEMERAGLDQAAFYRAISGSHPGDWGLVYADGSPKPAWWVFRAWSQMTGDRLLTSGDDPANGLWVRATRDAGCVSVLLTNFVATGAPTRTISLNLQSGMPPCQGARVATLGTLDTTSTSLADAPTIELDHNNDAGPIDHVDVTMPSQSVALLRVGCTPA